MSSTKNTYLVWALPNGSLRSLYLACWLTLLSGVAVVEAQVTGSISGYLKDPSGAAVPGANVTAVMVEQQVIRKS
jgi:hypothetical protein